MTTKPESTTEETLEPCGVCKFHWDMIVMPGEEHNRNCPHFHDAEKGCACQGCGQHYKVDVQVPGDLWNRIKPEAKPNGAGLLCGRCIFSRVEALSEFAAFRLSPASAAPVADEDEDLISRADAIHIAKAHDRTHSSGYRCYEGEAIAEKIATLPRRVVSIRTAAARTAQAIVDGGLVNPAPIARSWTEGKCDIPSAAATAAPVEQEVYVSGHPVTLRCNTCGLVQVKSFKCPRGDGQLVLDAAPAERGKLIGTAKSQRCIHCDPSFVPTGTDSPCGCQCHNKDLEEIF